MLLKTFCLFQLRDCIEIQYNNQNQVVCLIRLKIRNCEVYFEKFLFINYFLPSMFVMTWLLFCSISQRAQKKTLNNDIHFQLLSLILRIVACISSSSSSIRQMSVCVCVRVFKFQHSKIRRMYFAGVIKALLSVRSL